MYSLEIIKTEGLLRLPGNYDNVEILQKKLNDGKNMISNNQLLSYYYCI